MPKTVVISCDECNAIKGKGNGWWIGRKVSSGPGCPIVWNFEISPFSSLGCDDTEHGFYCGQACLFKAISRWMAETK